ncbi:hypothetical protein [Cellulomonas persica]|uniref:hypothetical protein n=1 Tax=Cellulomonas persica TaxID=76861 RepID=UPI0011BECDFF|nr:hypothetical protein [Cellulomonas persica]
MPTRSTTRIRARLAAVAALALGVTGLVVAPASAAPVAVPAAAPAAETSAGSSTTSSLVTAAGGPVTAATVKYVGNGTARSCTPTALAKAVRSGGTIKFRCGPKKVAISLDRTLYTCNTTTCRHPWEDPTARVVAAVVIDGGGKVILSGAGKRGIFYANTCEKALGWLDAHCNTQTTPHVTFRNIVLKNGNATKGPVRFESVGGGGGGGAIAMRGGRLTVQDSQLRDNRCMTKHSDAGGGAIRVTGQVTTARIVRTTFERNSCANGGAVSALHASLLLRDSTLVDNTATGSGANAGQGGNGGAVYFDGTHQDVTVERTTIQRNVAPEGGPGVFYVSNDRTGTLTITSSTITKNTGASFWTGSTRSLFFLGKKLVRSGSTIT